MKTTCAHWPAILVVLLSPWFTGIAAAAQTDEGFTIVHPEARKDPAAFIRDHRVMVGAWTPEEKTKWGWKGDLSYPSFNHNPDYLYMIYVEVLHNPVLEKQNLDDRNIGRLLLATHKTEKGKQFVIGYASPRPRDPAVTWMPSSLADHGPGFFKVAGLRYARIVSDAVKALSSTDAIDRKRGIRALSFVGEEARPHVPLIVKALSDSDETVVDQAMRLLGNLGGPDAEAAIPQMIEILKARGSRSSASTTLGKFGAKAQAAVPTLVQMLKNESDSTVFTRSTLEVLGLIAPGDPRVVAAVAPYLDGDDHHARPLARTASGLDAAN